MSTVSEHSAGVVAANGLYIGPTAAASQAVVDIPFNALLQVKQCHEQERLLSLAARPSLLNHIGTIHAGALLALAEAASAEFLSRYFGPCENVVPLVRRLEAKFCAPAQGSITSTATAAEEELDRFRRELAARGWSLIKVEAEVYDESQTKVLTATVTWFAQCVDDASGATGSAGAMRIAARAEG